VDKAIKHLRPLLNYTQQFMRVGLKFFGDVRKLVYDKKKSE